MERGFCTYEKTNIKNMSYIRKSSEQQLNVEYFRIFGDGFYNLFNEFSPSFAGTFLQLT